MRPLHDPADLTPDQQLREVAAVFAAGLLRLRWPIIPPNSGAYPPPNNPPGVSVS
jgi:hypothetical protein